MSITPPISSLPSGYQTPTNQSTHTFTPEQLYQGLINVPEEKKERKDKNAPMPGGRRKKRRKYRRKRKSRKSRRKRKSRKSRKKRRKTRRKKGGMMSDAENERIKKLKNSIPFTLSMKMRKMNPTQKLAAFKKIGISKDDVLKIKRLVEAEKAFRAHEDMKRMANKAAINKTQQAGRRTRRKRKRRTRRKLQHGGAGGVEAENWRPNNTYGFIKAADFTSKIPADSYPSYTANPSINCVT